MKSTKQLSFWKSNIGKAYTQRWDLPVAEINRKTKRMFGQSLSDLFTGFLKPLKISSILEVGCNTGRKIEMVSRQGNYQLYGIDPQIFALKKARLRLPQYNFIEATVFDLPFKDNFFDLVYTSEVLIHISPSDLYKATTEIVRTSKKFIFGFEYHNPKEVTVKYRGHTNQLWKRDFESFYLKHFSNLKTAKSQLLEWSKSVYNQSGLYSKMFLLEKR